MLCIFQYHESLWSAQVQEDGRGLCLQFRDTVHHYQVHLMHRKLYWWTHSDVIQAVCRPGRLTDGTYTSYDLNTLLKATAGERRAVVIGKGFSFCYSPASNDDFFK